MTTLTHRLSRMVSRLPTAVRAMLSLLLAIYSHITFRNLLIVYLLANAKNLPLSWEIRLIYRSWQQWRSRAQVAKVLQKAIDKTSPRSSTETTSTVQFPASAHPLFQPTLITSHTPLLEIDHNIHKSNSTYFSDLDESRTALMISLLSPTNFSGRELESKGFKKGRFAVILGSVHTSFLKEVKPYETYSVRSRVLGWGEKWIIIGSYFVKSVGKKEVLLACCLSKYVVKKGRYTVPPEACFRAAGWLPDRPVGTQVLGDKTGTHTPATPATPATPTDGADEDGKVVITEDDLRKRAQENAAKAVEKLQEVKEGVSSGDKEFSWGNEHAACIRLANRWDWDEIEKERARGMAVVSRWLELDEVLKGEYGEDLKKGLI